MRRLCYWLGWVWDIRPWPRCEVCRRKAAWSAFIDCPEYPNATWFYCDADVGKRIAGSELTNILTGLQEK